MATTDAEPEPEVDPRDVEKPRGRTSMLTIALVVLNLTGLAGFAVMLYMDVSRQQQWASALYLRSLALVGLPVDSQQLGAHDSDPEHGTEPLQTLDPPLIKEAYKQRGLSPKGKFLEVKEILRHNIRYPVEPDMKKKYFANVKGGEVDTLKDELDRVRKSLPGDIDKIAEDVGKKMADKNDDGKRQLIRDMLFPTAIEGSQIARLEGKLRATSGKDLDNLVVDAAKRKMLSDILQPMEIFRPSEPGTELYVDASKELTKRKVKTSLLDRVAELQDAPTADLVKLLDKRFDDVYAKEDWVIKDGAKRDNAEKRRSIAFLLLVISQLELPGGATLPAEAPKKDDDKNPPADKDKKGKKPGADKAMLQDDDRGFVKFQAQPDKKDDAAEQPVKVPELPSLVKERPPRNFAFPDAELRVEVVVGLNAFNQACLDLAIVSDLMRDRMVQNILRDRGDFLYPLAGRIHDPARFTDQLIKLMKDLKVNFTREDDFKQELIKNLTALQGKVRSGDELLAIVEKSMEQRASAENPGDDNKLKDLKHKQFQTAVAGVLYANAIGFRGKYESAVERIEALAGLIKVRKRELAHHEDLLKKSITLLDERDTHEKEIHKKIIAARATTQQLAKDLQHLQQELFLAQIDLIGAHEYNLYLEQHLRAVERRMVQGKGGKGK